HYARRGITRQGRQAPRSRNGRVGLGTTTPPENPRAAAARRSAVLRDRTHDAPPPTSVGRRAARQPCFATGRPAGRSVGPGGPHGLAGMEHPVQVDIPTYAERPRCEQSWIVAVPPARADARPRWSPPVIGHSPEMTLWLRHLIVAPLVSHRNLLLPSTPRLRQ